MKLFYTGKDGGPDSNVSGFWLIEWKRYFSIALLKFSDGSREAFARFQFLLLAIERPSAGRESERADEFLRAFGPADSDSP